MYAILLLWTMIFCSARFPFSQLMLQCAGHFFFSFFFSLKRMFSAGFFALIHCCKMSKTQPGALENAAILILGDGMRHILDNLEFSIRSCQCSHSNTERGVLNINVLFSVLAKVCAGQGQNARNNHSIWVLEFAIPLQPQNMWTGGLIFFFFFLHGSANRIYGNVENFVSCQDGWTIFQECHERLQKSKKIM